MQWSSELNLPIPIHFSSLIPKMLIFTLAISCLTMSNLPWFMDLTFQVPMKYYSLQHQTLLAPPDTAECPFHFGPASSFFLEQLLCSSPVAYWTPSDLGAHPLHESQPCHSKGARVTQGSCEPCSAGPSKMDRSWWTVLAKRCPLEEGTVNRSSILALRTPWTVWTGTQYPVKLSFKVKEK